ncbi:MAG: EAL domain-containing protein [Culicoidibacterales bacterium]
MNQLHQNSDRYQFMHELQMKQNYYLICFDIVNFKKINEKYRFENGDFVLAQIINQLQELNKIQNSLTICRYESDIILVAVDTTLESDVLTIMDAVAGASYKYPLEFRGGFKKITSEHALDYFFESITYVIKYEKYILNQQANSEHSLEGDVKKYFAIKQDITVNDGECFQLVYQPKISNTDRAVHSCEVLSRWIHPTMGLIMPYQFLPIIEHLDKESEFDRIIFKKACQELSSNPNIPPVFSINICISSLIQADFWEFAVNCAKQYGIPTKQIMIEIVENICEQNEIEVIENIEKLTEHGFSISIDDFGTGYSSYARLAAVNFTEVKIPREFLLIEGTNAEKRNYTILEGIVSLCKILNCSIVIEGVETIENIALAKELKIDYLQGYYFAKPLSQDEYAQFLIDYTK